MGNNRVGIPRRSEAEIMAMGGQGDTSATLGSADAPLTQRDIERNYGGDATKAAVCQAVDSGTPVVLPWIRFSEDAQRAYSNREFEEVAFQGLQISLGKRLAAGTVQQATDEGGRLVYCTGRSEDKTPTYSVAPAGTHVNGQPVVDVDLDLLKVAVGDVIAHRATLPVSKQEVMKAFASQRQLMEGDGQRWPGLQRTNPKANFSPVAEMTSRARELFTGVVDAGKSNFREAYNLLREAAAAARTIARDDLVRVIRLELGSVKDGLAVARFSAKIQEALAMSNPDQARKTLVDVKKELETVYGASNPDFARQAAGHDRGTGYENPYGRGRRGPNDRGRSFQRRDGR